MKHRLLLLCFLLLPSPGLAYCGDYPRHVDPSLYQWSDPDPGALFHLYHNVLQGMILDDAALQEKWLRWAHEVYSPGVLGELLEGYGETLETAALFLEAARLYGQEAARYAGVYNVSAASENIQEALLRLEALSDATPVLRAHTVALGQRLRADPGVLLTDIGHLEALILEYQELARARGKELEDEEALDLAPTGLCLILEPENSYIGEKVRVTGRLTSGLDGVPGRVISLRAGLQRFSTLTDMAGNYSAFFTVPPLYSGSLEIHGVYWPHGDDAKTYTPSAASGTLTVMYHSQQVDLKYQEAAYPGRTWSLSGTLSHGGEGLAGFNVQLEAFGHKHQQDTGTGGSFSFTVPIPPQQETGPVELTLSSESRGVYRGTAENIIVNLVKQPLSLELHSPRYVFTGLQARIKYSTSSMGTPLDGCTLRFMGKDGVAASNSSSGEGSLGINIPLQTPTGEYMWRIVATPAEPWILTASATGSFHVVNSLVLLCSLTGLGALIYAHRRIPRPRPKKPGDPPMEAVAEPPSSSMAVEEAGSMERLFMAALRALEKLTGVTISPSDTLREYLCRLRKLVSERLADILSEAVHRYERHVYGRPGHADLEKVTALVAELEESQGED